MLTCNGFPICKSPKFIGLLQTNERTAQQRVQF
nr:MAG TPA: hypothetical protein [Caudoviricetes sp.]